MNLHEYQSYLDAVLIGRVLLAESVFPRLEAFSGNALYFGRGMPTMNKYKTVKEVCALTGLTRKHLYYFHHEKVVQAAAYANYSVEGYDGYKLYDDEAVEKLQQIALYYQLGLKRNEIRDIMRTPGYDQNMVLNHLLELEQSKRLQIERHIAALEYLKMVGLKNGQAGTLCRLSLDALGQTLLALRENTLISDEVPAGLMQFEKKLSVLVQELSRMSEEALFTSRGTAIIGQIFTLAQHYLGIHGAPFVAGLFISVLGEGELSQILQCEISTNQCKAVLQYIANHAELFR